MVAAAVAMAATADILMAFYTMAKRVHRVEHKPLAESEAPVLLPQTLAAPVGVALTTTVVATVPMVAAVGAQAALADLISVIPKWEQVLAVAAAVPTKMAMPTIVVAPVVVAVVVLFIFLRLETFR